LSRGILSGVLHTGKLWLVGTFVCWIAGLLFALQLTRNELITTAFTYTVLYLIFISLGGHFLLGEQFSLMKSFGIALALLGIGLLMLG